MSISSATETETSHEHKLRMDQMYRVQRHIYDLTRAYYLLGRDKMIGALDPPASGTILEIGCGTGRNLISVADRYPGTTVLGIDISSEMLRSAGAAIARRNLTHRIRLAEGDACDFRASLAFGVDFCDRIFFSYALSMIPDWTTSLRNAVRQLKPGGSLHIVDFGSCEGLPPYFRLGLSAWLRRFHVTPRGALSEYMRILADEGNHQLSVAHPYRGYAQHLVLQKFA